MKIWLFSFLIGVLFLEAEPSQLFIESSEIGAFPSASLDEGRFKPPIPPQDSFFYLMAGAVVPTASLNLGHLFHPIPELSIGKRNTGLWHDWDYCIGARMAPTWEELYVQSTYLFHPVARFGGYIGFGGRFGGFHAKYSEEERFRHSYGYYSEFLFQLGYEFFDTVPGFVQLQISSSRQAVIGYGFGF